MATQELLCKSLYSSTSLQPQLLDANGVVLECDRNQWGPCGHNYIDYVAQFSLWSSWFMITIGFFNHAGIWKEMLEGVDKTHDIEGQALGIVATHRTQRLFGKKLLDPRRYLVQFAMWLELPSVALIPFSIAERALGSTLSSMSWTGDLQDAIWTLGKLLLGAVVMVKSLWWVFQKTKLGVTIKFVDAKLISPMLFDVAYIPVMTAVINFAACSPGVESHVTHDYSTCQCVDEFFLIWFYAIVCFWLFFVGSLLFKLSMSDDVFAVQFRYPTSFSAIMTSVRSLCPIIEVSSIFFLKFYSAESVFIGIGGFYGFMMLRLFQYNYKKQPCLGSGQFQNNIRAITFATSITTSVSLIIMGLLKLMLGSDIPYDIVIYVTCGLLPFIWVATWKFNTKRAGLYHIPILKYPQLFQHANSRVKLVAAVSVPLLPTDLFTPQETLEALYLLRENIAQPIYLQNGLLVTYTCGAIIHLTNFFRNDIKSIIFDGTKSDQSFVPCTIWNLYTVKLSNLTITKEPRENRLRALVQRQGKILMELAINEEPYEHTLTTAEIKDVEAIRGSIMHSLKVAISSQFPVARIKAAKLLYEGYRLGAIRIAAPTFVAMASLLCSELDAALACSACSSLHELVILKHPLFLKTSDMCLKNLILRHNLLAISYILRIPRGSTTVIEHCLTLLNFALEEFLLASGQIAHDGVLTQDLVFNVENCFYATEWKAHYKISILLEDLILVMDQVSEIVVSANFPEEDYDASDNESSGCLGALFSNKKSKNQKIMKKRMEAHSKNSVVPMPPTLAARKSLKPMPLRKVKKADKSNAPDVEVEAIEEGVDDVVDEVLAKKENDVEEDNIEEGTEDSEKSAIPAKRASTVLDISDDEEDEEVQDAEAADEEATADVDEEVASEEEADEEDEEEEKEEEEEDEEEDEEEEKEEEGEEEEEQEEEQEEEEEQELEAKEEATADEQVDEEEADNAIEVPAEEELDVEKTEPNAIEDEKSSIVIPELGDEVDAAAIHRSKRNDSLVESVKDILPIDLTPKPAEVLSIKVIQRRRIKIHVSRRKKKNPNQPPEKLIPLHLINRVKKRRAEREEFIDLVKQIFAVGLEKRLPLRKMPHEQKIQCKAAFKMYTTNRIYKGYVESTYTATEKDYFISIIQGYSRLTNLT